MVNELNFSIFGENREAMPLQVIEIFPSEAIWSLGIKGYYGDIDSKTIRAYKKKKPKDISYTDAHDIAKLPLSAFSTLLPDIDIDSAIQTIVNHCCENSKIDNDTVSKGKGFDDPLESGIAFFTALCFTKEKHHIWGSGKDGTIVGPGVL
ncbi:MAG: hypothetical protein Q9M15_04025 [Mariprofundaceae bacterium]|nr:hypothetical protein [Mariprofundaceae bacterium]